MNSPRKVIRIKMSPRVASNSPEILETVVSVFAFYEELGDRDVHIDISEDGLKSAELPMQQEAVETAKGALDLQNQAVNEGIVTPKSPGEAKIETHQRLRDLGWEGFKVLVQTTVKEAIQNLI